MAAVNVARGDGEGAGQGENRVLGLGGKVPEFVSRGVKNEKRKVQSEKQEGARSENRVWRPGSKVPEFVSQSMGPAEGGGGGSGRGGGC